MEGLQLGVESYVAEIHHAACEACADFGGDIFWWWFHGVKVGNFLVLTFCLDTNEERIREHLIKLIIERTKSNKKVKAVFPLLKYPLQNLSSAG